MLSSTNYSPYPTGLLIQLLTHPSVLLTKQFPSICALLLLEQLLIHPAVLIQLFSSSSCSPHPAVLLIQLFSSPSCSPHQAVSFYLCFALTRPTTLLIKLFSASTASLLVQLFSLFSALHCFSPHPFTPFQQQREEFLLSSFIG